MKTRGQIISKLILCILFLYVSPLKDALKQQFQDVSDIRQNLLYQPYFLHKRILLKQKFYILSYHQNITLDELNEDIVFTSPPASITKANGNSSKVIEKNKKIYIYNTHQSEAYRDHKTVLDGALILADHLKKKGYEVIVETNDFYKYRIQNKLSYDDSYQISNYYLKKAIEKYGDFDMCIDLHRDSLPRNLSIQMINDQIYARSMLVVAGSSSNYENVNQLSNQITNKINKKYGEVMKYVMVRKEAYYNQFVAKNMILIECGSEQNDFDEVKNSLEAIAYGIDAVLEVNE